MRETRELLGQGMNKGEGATMVMSETRQNTELEFVHIHSYLKYLHLQIPRVSVYGVELCFHGKSIEKAISWLNHKEG